MTCVYAQMTRSQPEEVLALKRFDIPYFTHHPSTFADETPAPKELLTAMLSVLS